jgi:hypothetical protein
MKASISVLMTLLLTCSGFCQAVREAPGEVRAAIRSLYSRGLYDRAVVAGSQVLREYPDEPNISRYVAMSQLFLGHWEKASTILAPFYLEWPGSSSARVIALSQTLGGSKVANLKDLYLDSDASKSKMAQEYLVSHKDGIEQPLFWIILLSEGYIGDDGNQGEIKLYLKKGIELSPKDTFINEILAKGHSNRDRFDESIKCYKIAIDAAGKDRRDALKAALAEVKKRKTEKEKREAEIRELQKRAGGG